MPLTLPQAGAPFVDKAGVLTAPASNLLLSLLNTFQTPMPTAFASLPGTPVTGMLRVVTDSNTATWGATIAAGGANVVLAFFNGSAWTVAAI